VQVGKAENLIEMDWSFRISQLCFAMKLALLHRSSVTAQHAEIRSLPSHVRPHKCPARGDLAIPLQPNAQRAEKKAMKSSTAEFEARKAEALHLFKQTSLRPENFAPAVVRLAWRAGIQIPPPYFASFISTAVFSGAHFIVIVSAVRWLISWRFAPTPPGNFVVGILIGAVIAGLGNAAGYAFARRKFGLPLWRDLRIKVSSGSAASAGCQETPPE
jgi:hypothetical protein